jgi:uncharacterized glyoxalase superfamily protein PhnB
MSSVTPDRAPPEFEAATQVLVVSDSARSRDFYSGAPTLDKPTVRFVAPADPDTVSHEITLRVGDCRSVYQLLMRRGVEFLTPPVESEWEVRAFFRDPDGHLFEISEVKGGRH